GTGISTLWCPSDPEVKQGDDIADPRYLFYFDGTGPPPGSRQVVTSYAGNAGVSIVGYGPAWPVEFQLERTHATGTIYIQSNIPLADIPDGTSNTMLFSERDWSTLKALNKDNFPESKYWWNSGWWSHTTFTAMGPPNFSRNNPDYFEQGSWWLFNV